MSKNKKKEWDTISSATSKGQRSVEVKKIYASAEERQNILRKYAELIEMDSLH